MGPVNHFLSVLVAASCRQHVLETKDLGDFVLQSKDRRAYLGLEATTELPHLGLVHVTSRLDGSCRHAIQCWQNKPI